MIRKASREYLSSKDLDMFNSVLSQRETGKWINEFKDLGLTRVQFLFYSIEQNKINIKKLQPMLMKCYKTDNTDKIILLDDFFLRNGYKLKHKITYDMVN